MILYLLILEMTAAAGVVVAAISLRPSQQALGRALLLFALAVLFEETTKRAGQMRLRLSDNLKPDMTSVWSFPAAILLPAPYAAACVGALLWYMWLRQQRSAGEVAFRKVGTAATILIACLTVSWLFELIGTSQMPSRVGFALAVIIALFVYTAVNRGLITGALLLLGVRGRGLVGTWEDNLLEFATLCLGGLAVLAVRDEPWLASLVLLPMVLLERGALTRQLEIAATIDFKTGLLNATAWEQLAQREMSRAHREGYPTALFIIDIDRFKAVNDAHGHLVGDVALKAVGQCLMKEMRDYDTVGRFGGEEFVALLPGVSESEAMSIAQRLRTAIHEIRISNLVLLADASVDSLLAVSIGVACSPRGNSELIEQLHAADKALYAAKQAGRNCVELARGDAGSGAAMATS